mmetsp:Transcript_7208/g.21088  ORF Transcript_7208/g.21088 Transcript_7208/m.21088 type:complete len:401 (-) Transcript_7208:542-1744(-)
MEVATDRLAGHTAEVLALLAPTDEAPHLPVLTGAADGSIRVWDRRDGGGRRGVKCLRPMDGAPDFEDTATTALAWGLHEHQVFAALGNAVVDVDLRAGGIIAKEECNKGVLLTADDEINCIARGAGAIGAAMEAGSSASLATADDAGVVRRIEIRAKRFKGRGEIGATVAGQARLRAVHENSIASCAAFRPGCATELVSGGLDCTVMLHDVASGRRIWEHNVKPYAAASAAGAGSAPAASGALSYSQSSKRARAVSAWAGVSTFGVLPRTCGAPTSTETCQKLRRGNPNEWNTARATSSICGTPASAYGSRPSAASRRTAARATAAWPGVTSSSGPRSTPCAVSSSSCVGSFSASALALSSFCSLAASSAALASPSVRTSSKIGGNTKASSSGTSSSGPV